MSATEERVDIAPTIDALCKQFGFDKTTVRSILFEPTQLTFYVYALDDDGRMRSLAGDPIVDVHSFKVTT